MKEQQLIPGEAGILEGRIRHHHAVRIHPIVGEIYGGLHEEESGALAVKDTLVANARTMATIMHKNPVVEAAKAEATNTVIYLNVGDTYYTNNKTYIHGVNDGTNN